MIAVTRTIRTHMFETAPAAAAFASAVSRIADRGSRGDSGDRVGAGVAQEFVEASPIFHSHALGLPPVSCPFSRVIVVPIGTSRIWQPLEARRLPGSRNLWRQWAHGPEIESLEVEAGERERHSRDDRHTGEHRMGHPEC
jgi:hypothetical protein